MSIRPSTLPDSIRTDRLVLRRWRDEDLRPFAKLNADPEVMQYMPVLLDRRESDALATRIREQLEQRGFGLWAVEIPEAVPFIGYVGLSVPRFTAAFTPCVEIGWLDEIVSFTVPANARSIAVMERLGMSRDPADDFDHPTLPAGHPLRRHVLYRLTCTSRS